MPATGRIAALILLLMPAVPLINADCAAIGAEASGRVEGTIFYREGGKHAWRLARYYVKRGRTGELAEAAVGLEGPGLSRPAPPGRPALTTIDQKDMRFVPESVAIRAGGKVRFTNSDPQTHNISTADPRHPFSITIGRGQEAIESFARPGGVRGPFALGCAFHSQMQGWIYVFDHPYFQITGTDGRFRLEGIPPGDYRLAVAHAAGDLRATRPIRIKANESLKIDWVLTPADRTGNDR